MLVRLAKFNEVPAMWCFACGDSGLVEFCRADETILRYESCGCKYPIIWKAPFDWKLSDVERIAKRRDHEELPF